MGAPISVQANALLRKSLTVQKRNVRGNCCLISAPILLCIILGVLQVAINKVIDSNEDLQCGCQCTQCCNVATGVCIVSTGYCNTENDINVCRARNTKNCGTQYSSASQSAFCPVASPAVWPAPLQVPEPEYRALRDQAPYAQPQGSAAAMLVTGTSQTLTASLSAAMFQQLAITTLDEFAAMAAQLSASGAGTFAGYLLTQAGFVFGTTADLQNNIYVEESFLPNSQLYAMLPGFTCAAKGLTTPNMTFDAFVAAYLGLPLDAGPGFDATVLGLVSLADIRITCVDAPLDYQPNLVAVQDLLYCGYRQARCNGSQVFAEYSSAWDWQSTTQSEVQLTVIYNGTDAAQQGQGADSVANRLPMQLNLALRSWWANYFGNAADPFYQPLQLLGVQSMPTRETKLRLDFGSLLGPLFFTWIVQLLLPTILQQLVYEKERRLRIMMKMHGLGDGPYWLITYAWYFALYAVYITVFCIIGAIVRLKVFPYTSVGIQVIFYFLFGNCMIAFAFMLSSLFASSRTAVSVGFLYVFASGLIGELLFKPFMDKDKSWLFFVEWVPAWSLYRGLYEMGAYTFLAVYRGEKKGLQFSNLSDPGCGMRAVWGIFAVEWAIFMLLAYYFEQVLSEGTGIRRHPLFFLQRKRAKAEQSHQLEMSVMSTAAAAGGDPTASSSRPSSVGLKANTTITFPLTSAPEEREDVAAERHRVEKLVDVSNWPIVIKDLKKIYPGQDGGPPKLAVRGLTMAIERGECFGLLGPNGAGKTTSINMLVGFLEPTGGSAMIEGLDITKDMTTIYNQMGVCPQHDLLWETLSGREHLLFYGRLKCLKGAELDEAVESGLRSVNLWLAGVADKHSQKYSGGMKRRLSVAISFIGCPKVVYLDEPSTGLDPASRRNLWEVVKGNKAGRATILTTHSMEEAEMLCDRLGIFVDGQLVCIGNPKEITNRYAGYLVFQIMVPAGEEAGAQALVLSMAPGARLTYSLGGTLKYELPTSEVTLSHVFSTMASAKANGMHVLDWGVANATLEEVFIKFARTLGATTKD